MEYIYAALLLHKLGQPVDETHLKKVVTATGAEVDEAKVKSLMASLQGLDIASEIANAGAVAMAPAGGSGEAKAEKKEEKKEEGPSESAAGLASLFG